MWLAQYAIKVDENHCSASYLLFFKVSYYFTPVALLSFFSQNTLHICGAFALVALFLCIVCCFFSGLSLYITSSERLFLNILYVVASHPRPLRLCHKNLFPSTEYLLDLGASIVYLSHWTVSNMRAGTYSLLESPNLASVGT